MPRSNLFIAISLFSIFSTIYITVAMTWRFRRALEMYLSVSVIVCLLSTCHGFAVSSNNEAEFNVQEDDINDRGKVIK